MTVRLTEKRSMSAASLGSRDPGERLPERISERSAEMTAADRFEDMMPVSQFLVLGSRSQPMVTVSVVEARA